MFPLEQIGASMPAATEGPSLIWSGHINVTDRQTNVQQKCEHAIQ